MARIMTDFLIIGQGLAGTLLAHFLQSDGYTVRIMDEYQVRASTRVAAGLINPVTGRRFVKSWRIDDLLPFARQTYRLLESQLGVALYHERPIYRALYSVEEENLWLERCADPQYRQYVSDEGLPETIAAYIHPPRGFGRVNGGAQVNIGTLVDAFRQRATAEGILEAAPFDFAQLQISEDAVRYGSLSARHIVFCEGRWGKTNPLFSELPLVGDKGEVLLVRLPAGVSLEAIIKHRVFVVPMGEDLYWVGSNYSSRYESDAPTEQGRGWLEENLRRSLRCSFEVLDHRAAVRPTVKDRRPLLGRHSEYSNVLIFNGLGTKGTSLGPFWARHFADFLGGKTELDAEVDVRRFG
jgi:glycine/D-amino acid oxidase-like deaminating enzyme